MEPRVRQLLLGLSCLAILSLILVGPSLTGQAVGDAEPGGCAGDSVEATADSVLDRVEERFLGEEEEEYVNELVAPDPEDEPDEVVAVEDEAREEEPDDDEASDDEVAGSELADYFMCNSKAECPVFHGECIKRIPYNRIPNPADDDEGKIAFKNVVSLFPSVAAAGFTGVCTKVCTDKDGLCSPLHLKTYRDANDEPLPWTCQVVMQAASPYPRDYPLWPRAAGTNVPEAVAEELDPEALTLGVAFGAICRPPLGHAGVARGQFCSGCNGGNAGDCANGLCYDYKAMAPTEDGAVGKPGMCHAPCGENDSCPVGFGCTEFFDFTERVNASGDSDDAADEAAAQAAIEDFDSEDGAQGAADAGAPRFRSLGKFCKARVTTCTSCLDLDSDGMGVGRCLPDEDGEPNNEVVGVDCDDRNRNAYYDASDLEHPFINHCGAWDYNCDGLSDDEQILGNEAYGEYHCSACGDACSGEAANSVRTCDVAQRRCFAECSAAADDCEGDECRVYADCDEDVANGCETPVGGEGDTYTATVLYPDQDSDGRGSADGAPRSQCFRNEADADPETIEGYVANRDDCDDDDATTYDGATEVCNGRDSDCDGTVDNVTAVTDRTRCTVGTLQGACRDGFLQCPDCPTGDCEAVQPLCVSAVLPTDEICDGIDNDCDGEIDELEANGCEFGQTRWVTESAWLPGDQSQTKTEGQCAQLAQPVCGRNPDGQFVQVCAPGAAGTEPDEATAEDENCDGWWGDSRKSIFVASGGSDAFDGTLAQPVRTLRRAIELSGSSRRKFIYVEAGRQTTQATIDLPNGVQILGGYDAGFTQVVGMTRIERYGLPDSANRVVIIKGRNITDHTLLKNIDMTILLTDRLPTTRHAPGKIGIECYTCPALALENVQIQIPDGDPGDDGANGPDGPDGGEPSSALGLAEADCVVDGWGVAMAPERLKRNYIGGEVQPVYGGGRPGHGGPQQHGHSAVPEPNCAFCGAPGVGGRGARADMVRAHKEAPHLLSADRVEPLKNILGGFGSAPREAAATGTAGIAPVGVLVGTEQHSVGTDGRVGYPGGAGGASGRAHSPGHYTYTGQSGGTGGCGGYGGRAGTNGGSVAGIIITNSGAVTGFRNVTVQVGVGGSGGKGGAGGKGGKGGAGYKQSDFKATPWADRGDVHHAGGPGGPGGGGAGGPGGAAGGCFGIVRGPQTTTHSDSLTVAVPSARPRGGTGGKGGAGGDKPVMTTMAFGKITADSQWNRLRDIVIPEAPAGADGPDGPSKDLCAENYQLLAEQVAQVSAQHQETTHFDLANDAHRDTVQLRSYHSDRTNIPRYGENCERHVVNHETRHHCETLSFVQLRPVHYSAAGRFRNGIHLHAAAWVHDLDQHRRAQTNGNHSHRLHLTLPGLAQPVAPGNYRVVEVAAAHREDTMASATGGWGATNARATRIAVLNGDFLKETAHMWLDFSPRRAFRTMTVPVPGTAPVTISLESGNVSWRHIMLSVRIREIRRPANYTESEPRLVWQLYDRLGEVHHNSYYRGGSGHERWVRCDRPTTTNPFQTTCNPRRADWANLISYQTGEHAGFTLFTRPPDGINQIIIPADRLPEPAPGKALQLRFKLKHNQVLGSQRPVGFTLWQHRPMPQDYLVGGRYAVENAAQPGGDELEAWRMVEHGQTIQINASNWSWPGHTNPNARSYVKIEVYEVDR